MDRAYLEERIAVTKTAIEAWEDAELALGTSGGVQTYTIDTGQTRTTVSRQQLGQVRATLDALYNRLEVLENRLNGTGVVNVRPAW